MISKQLLGQAEYRLYRRTYLPSLLAEIGREFGYVLRAVMLRAGNLNLQHGNWESMGVLGQFASSIAFVGSEPAKANGTDDPISECNRCWSQAFRQPQERFRT